MEDKVAYLGPPSSYTHQAALSKFGEKATVLESSISIADVFESVQSESVKYGVVPFENSTNGSVVSTLDLLIDREKCYPGVNVCGEAYIGVHHCLLGYSKGGSSLDETAESGTITPTFNVPNPRSSRTRPKSDLRHVRRIYSHFQAFGQCEAFLSTYLKGVERQEVSSTSKAAEIVAEDASGTTAAISSGLAADIHRLKVLAEGIEDREDNTTRFFILEKLDTQKHLMPSEQSATNGAEHSKDWKTLLAFRINHQMSGALAKALSVFGDHNLNLTSINSRPSRECPWHYVFMVELSDKRTGNGSAQVRDALKDLTRCTQSWKWLGTWIDEGSKDF